MDARSAMHFQGVQRRRACHAEDTFELLDHDAFEVLYTAGAHHEEIDAVARAAG
jgi:hypothetical protein